MTIKQAMDFYNNDKKEYILNKNKDFLKWYNKEIKNGYHPLAEISHLQNVIDIIVNWYEFKYPERELEYHEGTSYPKFEQIRPISKNMSFEQLMYRLPHNELCLMECEYRSNGWGCDGIFMSIKNKIPNENYDLNYIDRFLLNANPDTGKVVIDYYIKKITAITDLTLDELLGIFEKNWKKSWDYTSLKESVHDHNIDLELRKKILELAALKLLYSENTIPERGLIRAQRFIAEFNKHISNLNLTTNKIDELVDSSHSYAPVKKYELKIWK